MNENIIPRPSAYRRVRTPTRIQIEATECGAVCLAIILAHFGKFLSIEQLRIACGISRDGSNAKNIVEAAEGYQLQADGYSLEVEDLYQLPLPAILFWKFEHFVVLEGFDKKHVYLNDPATGPRSISYDELDSDFTGIAITLQPGTQFKKSGRPPGVIEAIYNRLKNVKAALLFAALIGLCLVVPNLAFPALTQVFIDRVLVAQNLDWKNGILAGLLLVMAVKGLLIFLQGKAINRLKTRLSVALGSETLWHMLRLPMEFYLQRYPGEVAYRLTLNESINHALADDVITLVLSVLFAFSYGVAILYYDYTIALVAMSVMAANLLLMQCVYSSRSDMYARYQSDSARSTAYAIGGLENIEMLKAGGSTRRFFQTWAAYYTRLLNALQAVGRKDIFLTICTQLLQALTYFIFIAVGGWRVIDGQLTVGMFIAVQILLFSLIQPVVSLAGVNQSLQFLKVDMARLDDLMRYPIDSVFKPPEARPQQTSKLSGAVDIRHVTFGYSRCDEPMLKDISLTLAAGKSVALVGPSGSGKSTLARIIAGLLHPWEGEVLFDGKSQQAIPRELFVNSMALVESDPFIFTASIKDNLTFLDPTIPLPPVIAAAKCACLHDTIMSRPGGYELMLEENGANLSGGERQRLEIARAGLKQPAILILDEGTNSLDAFTEHAIMQHLRNSGSAMLLIAHRLSSIRDCDEIIVLDLGKIIAKGTHARLMEHCPLYHALVTSEQQE